MRLLTRHAPIMQGWWYIIWDSSDLAVVNFVKCWQESLSYHDCDPGSVSAEVGGFCSSVCTFKPEDEKQDVNKWRLTLNSKKHQSQGCFFDEVWKLRWTLNSEEFAPNCHELRSHNSRQALPVGLSELSGRGRAGSCHHVSHYHNSFFVL